jgi:hypothetical protein
MKREDIERALNLIASEEKTMDQLRSLILKEKDTPTIAQREGTVVVEPIKNASMLFPEDLKVLLSFESEEDHWLVKPKQFLGSENFSRIAAIVRQVKGEYVSAGKASHFKIPK